MPRDTHPESLAVQRRIFARMSGAQRVALMVEMSEEARQVTLAGLRRQFPQASEAEIVRIERERRLGVALTEAAWPRR